MEPGGREREKRPAGNDGFFLTLPQPAPEGGLPGRVGGQETAGAEPGKPPVGTRRHNPGAEHAARRTRSRRDTRRGLTGHDRAGGMRQGSRAGGAAAGHPQHTAKRGATSGKRGTPRPLRAESEDRERARERPRRRGPAGDRTAANPRREAEEEDGPTVNTGPRRRARAGGGGEEVDRRL